jgi:hypothetical protein
VVDDRLSNCLSRQVTGIANFGMNVEWKLTCMASSQKPSQEKDFGSKDFFEIVSIFHAQGARDS